MRSFCSSRELWGPCRDEKRENGSSEDGLKHEELKYGANSLESSAETN